MVFSDTTDYAGMVQECERALFSSDYGRITNNTKLLKEFTSYLNQGLDEVTIKVLQSDNTWEFDDSEHSDQPIATADLNTDQVDYELAASHLLIKRVEAKDSSGNWVKLRPVDNREVKIAMDEFRDEPGELEMYDLQGSQLKLYPATNYNSSAGLKVYFQRPMDYFETSDTTKAPGFASIFHRLVPLWATYFYATYHQMPIADNIRAEIQLKERDLKQFYRGRHEDMPKRIVPAFKSSR